MSDPSYTPPEPASPEEWAAALREITERANLSAGPAPRRGQYQLGVIGAFILVAACTAIMAFPVGLACAGAWWIFMAGWNVIYG